MRMVLLLIDVQYLAFADLFADARLYPNALTAVVPGRDLASDAVGRPSWQVVGENC